MCNVLIEIETPVEFNECISFTRLPTIDVDVGKVCEISGLDLVAAWGPTQQRLSASWC